MAYNSNLPMDNTADIRENFRGLKDDKIVAAASAISAETAAKLAVGRKISLEGDATGSATFDGSVDVSITVDVVSADSSAMCTGNASTATKLKTARTINGVLFDGSADITITQINGKDIATVDQIPTASASVPVGAIIMWSGSIAAIPNGYALCNGQNGSPDLRNRFVVGSGSDIGTHTPNGVGGIASGYFAPGDQGGEEMHQLTITEMPSHNHSILLRFYDDTSHGSTMNVNDGYGNLTGQGETNYSGGSQAHNTMPPYYSLAYIMRIA